MARHLSRRLPLLRWQYLRWGLAIPTLPLALWACNSHPLKQPLPNPQMETDFPVLVSPDREIDLLFMIDNSPSMDPKQDALATNFPKLINILQTIPDGSGGKSLPDVHIGVISSDMGSGSEPIGVNCGRVLGDRGLLYGNDPNNPLASVAPGADPNKGGHPDPNGCGLHSGARWISDIADPSGNGKRIKNYDGNIQDVFSCLAKHVGVGGCGFEHQLQSTRVALNADYSNNPINPENIGFVRSRGYLAIVLITDEDDCSADPNDDLNNQMFVQYPLTETGSLRCATRGHNCGGQVIPDYTDPAVGYTGTGFSHAFADCTPRDQPNPSSPDHSYLPLIRVQDMIDSINGISAWVVDKNGNSVTDGNGNHISIQKTPDKILVSGIIGWPPDTTLPNVTVTDQYRIDKDATSLPSDQAKLWDYMPICTVPSQHSADGNIYKGYGGLRLKKFLDAFQKKDPSTGKPVPNTFSLCNTDFTGAMTAIANAIVQVLKPGCVEYPLIDTNSAAPGIQPECQVIDRIPCDVPGTPKTCLASGYEETSRPECIDNTTGLPLNPTSTQTPTEAQVPDSARPCWYLYYDTSPAGCADAPKGQRITVLRPSGTNAPAGTVLDLKCLTCARADGKCCPVDDPGCDRSKL